MSGFSGHLSLRAAIREHGRTVLAAQSFRAPFHISKPYWDADACALLVQVVNPTAGILAGDRLESAIAVDDGAALLVTTPSATRLFRMRDGAAECRQHFSVSNGAWLEVMPEPLVPHRGSRYRQTTTIDVETGGALFFVDQLMAGRAGHGELWQWERLQLELTVNVGGALVLRERLDQGGPELGALANFAGSGATACFASAVIISPQANEDAAWLTAVRQLHGDGIWVGVSALRQGGWTMKLIAPDALRLRVALREVRKILSAHLPRLGCNPRKL
ncbi:MAG: urease accessory protein UreD [Opitutaceae bacterium]|nr:urease accessory protein UreD [Opitutaceae bacterium]